MGHFSVMISVPKPSIFTAGNDESSSKDDLVVQRGGSECAQRKEKLHSHSPSGHSCPGRNNLSTLAYDP